MPKAAPRLGSGHAKGVFDFTLVQDQFDTAAAAAGRSFEQQGIADVFSKQGGFVRIARMIRTGHQRHAGIAGDFTGFEFVAHHRDVFGARTDESDLVVDACLSQCRPLGKKTVTGVERVAAGTLRCGDDVLNF